MKQLAVAKLNLGFAGTGKASSGGNSGDLPCPVAPPTVSRSD